MAGQIGGPIARPFVCVFNGWKIGIENIIGPQMSERRPKMGLHIRPADWLAGWLRLTNYGRRLLAARQCYKMFAASAFICLCACLSVFSFLFPRSALAESKSDTSRAAAAAAAEGRDNALADLRRCVSHAHRQRET